MRSSFKYKMKDLWEVVSGGHVLIFWQGTMNYKWKLKYNWKWNLEHVNMLTWQYKFTSVHSDVIQKNTSCNLHPLVSCNMQFRIRFYLAWFRATRSAFHRRWLLLTCTASGILILRCRSNFLISCQKYVGRLNFPRFFRPPHCWNKFTFPFLVR